jgi:hypothetical protein
MIDKYGYETPAKKGLELKNGSGQGFEEFRNKMEDLVNQVRHSYKDENGKGKGEGNGMANQFNLLFGAVSELMSQLIIEAIERHERGEEPEYGRLIAHSYAIRKRIKELEMVFHIQEAAMAEYLTEHPLLIRDENEVIVTKMKNLGKFREAAIADELFQEALKKMFKEMNK